MLTATEIAGFAGAGLAGAAYIPQIAHLIRARCSAGISRTAFEIWLLASFLTTAQAIDIRAGVFIVLGGIQIVATTLISGARLAQETWYQAWTFGTTFLYMRRVEGLSRSDGDYRLRLSDGSVLTTRTVIIATGATYRRLGIPHLEHLQGRGVFYGAAASEAPAMRGRNVFVVGAGNSAGQTALHMAKWATRVTMLVRAESLAGSMSDYLIREIAATPNVDVSYRVRVAGGTGIGHLQSLILQEAVSGARRTVPADALFVLIGSQPRTQWLGETVVRDQLGFIYTGPDLPTDAAGYRTPGRPPLPLETSLPGVFAAGDVRRGSVKRVSSAAGEGAATIPSVHRHLHTAAAPAAAGR